MTDSTLLHTELRKQPNDLTLLSAYVDCLTEEGQTERAQVTDTLLETEQWLRTARYPTVMAVHERDRLRYRLGLTDIEVGSSLSYDRDGRVFPASVQQTAVAVAKPNPTTLLVQVQLTGDWNPYFRHTVLQTTHRL